MARRQEGFALLIVLWWTILLALLGTQLAVAARLEAQRTGNLRDAAMAEAAADGALQEAAFHLLQGGAGEWAADGTARTIAVPHGVATIEAVDETSKIGLNQATAGLLAALMAQVGVDRLQARSLADAILDWRTSAAQTASAKAYAEAGLAYAPPGSDFETLGELGLVRDISPALLQRLAPYLSVYQTGDPNLDTASPVVRAAWAQSGDIGATETDRLGLQTEAKPIVTITVRIAMASGARAAHRTVIELAEGSARAPFHVLAREQ